MRDVIHRHNLLNGLIFCVVEFGLIAALAGVLAVFYAIHARIGMAIVAAGIGLNCVPVVSDGLAEWRRQRASGERIPSFWNKAARNQHRKDNPHMLCDALTLTTVTLVPFLSLTAVLFDIFISAKRQPTKP